MGVPIPTPLRSTVVYTVLPVSVVAQHRRIISGWKELK